MHINTSTHTKRNKKREGGNEGRREERQHRDVQPGRKPQPLTLTIKHSWGPLKHEDFAQQFYFRECITRMEEEKEDEERERKEEEGERNMENKTF